MWTLNLSECWWNYLVKSIQVCEVFQSPELFRYSSCNIYRINLPEKTLKMSSFSSLETKSISVTFSDFSVGECIEQLVCTKITVQWCGILWSWRNYSRIWSEGYMHDCRWWYRRLWPRRSKARRWCSIPSAHESSISRRWSSMHALFIYLLILKSIHWFS